MNKPSNSHGCKSADKQENPDQYQLYRPNFIKVSIELSIAMFFTFILDTTEEKQNVPSNLLNDFVHSAHDDNNQYEPNSEDQHEYNDEHQYEYNDEHQYGYDDEYQDESTDEQDNLDQLVNNETRLLIDYEEKTYENYLSQIINFIHESKLTKTSTTSLLSLLKHTKTSSDRNIPLSIDSLWKQLNISFNYQTFFFCSTCFIPLAKLQDICSKCNNNQHNNSELCIFSLADELRRVVTSNIRLIEWYSIGKNQITADVVNSSIYKQKSKSNEPRLTLMINTDGKPIVKSKQSRTSVWPVISFLCEIPPPIREHLNNTMLLGLWHSPVSPPASLLLDKIVENIKVLEAFGMNIQIENGMLTIV
ncbi:unnamed protein product [Adineta steineri]|uniref:Uncharacterized protein n=1 Tax=Adineta steineri TaxID=433720 RepID=A0A814U912_9BILA|nr:unnamed protein product [Adineta steineri]